MATVPLTTLLSWAWIAHTIEVDNAVEAQGARHVGRLFRISLPMWANALRFVDEDGVTVGELRRRARADANLGGLERWGWIRVGEGTGGRREGYGTARGINDDTVLRPTRAGAYARRLTPKVVGEVEQRWRERFGEDVIEALSTRLAGRTGAPPMPWSPPEVHPSDGFFTHVVEAEPAEEGRAAAALPLAALLGQVLTSLTLDQELDALVSLPLALNVLRVVHGRSTAIRDLPARTGVSKEGIAMAVGFLQRRKFAAVSPNRLIDLLPRGRKALAGYQRRAGGSDRGGGGDRDGGGGGGGSGGAGELRGALDALLDQRQALSAAFEPPEGCWRGEKPYLAQTRRLLADPTGALAWHPMVLHRGGWPDAS